jgi:hypothetical protein
LLNSFGFFSSPEVARRAQLLLAKDQRFLGPEEYAELKGRSKKVSGQLYQWIQYCKKSEASKE